MVIFFLKSKCLHEICVNLCTASPNKGSTRASSKFQCLGTATIKTNTTSLGWLVGGGGRMMITNDTGRQLSFGRSQWRFLHCSCAAAACTRWKNHMNTLLKIKESVGGMKLKLSYLWTPHIINWCKLLSEKDSSAGSRFDLNFENKWQANCIFMLELSEASAYRLGARSWCLVI